MSLIMNLINVIIMHTFISIRDNFQAAPMNTDLSAKRKKRKRKLEERKKKQHEPGLEIHRLSSTVE